MLICGFLLFQKSKTLQDEPKGNTQASFLSSFSASNDNTLLMEVEELEAAVIIQNKDKNKVADTCIQSCIHSFSNSSTKKFEDALFKHEEVKKRKDAPGVDRNVSEKLSICELRTRGGAKRSYMHSNISIQVDEKLMETPKMLVAGDKLNFPSLSSQDKRPRRFSKVSPFRGNALDSGDLQIKNKMSQCKSPSKQKSCTFTDHNDLELISYSPLLSTSFNGSGICNITTGETTPPTSRSPIVKPSTSTDRSKQNQYSKKTVETSSIKRAKNKTFNKVKNIHVEMSSQKQMKDLISISTPRRSIKKTCEVKKKSTPATMDCQDISAFNVEEKSEGIENDETHNLSKHKRKILTPVKKGRKSFSIKHVSAINGSHNTSLSPPSLISVKPGLDVACSPSAQCSTVQNINGNSSNKRQNISSMSKLI